MRVLLLLLFVGTTAFAQKDIDEQVWKPFIRGFNDANTELFMSVHSKDLVRSGRDSKAVLSWDQYNRQTTEWNSKRRGKYTIELRFTERISNDNQAIDVGVYKTSWFIAADNQGIGYGRFHVVHRKENGVWKILVDTDSSEGGTIGESQFLAAKPME